MFPFAGNSGRNNEPDSIFPQPLQSSSPITKRSSEDTTGFDVNPSQSKHDGKYQRRTEKQSDGSLTRGKRRSFIFHSSGSKQSGSFSSVNINQTKKSTPYQRITPASSTKSSLDYQDIGSRNIAEPCFAHRCEKNNNRNVDDTPLQAEIADDIDENTRISVKKLCHILASSGHELPGSSTDFEPRISIASSRGTFARPTSRSITATSPLDSDQALIISSQFNSDLNRERSQNAAVVRRKSAIEKISVALSKSSLAGSQTYSPNLSGSGTVWTGPKKILSFRIRKDKRSNSSQLHAAPLELNEHEHLFRAQLAQAYENDASVVISEDYSFDNRHSNSARTRSLSNQHKRSVSLTPAAYNPSAQLIKSPTQPNDLTCNYCTRTTKFNHDNSSSTASSVANTTDPSPSRGHTGFADTNPPINVNQTLTSQADQGSLRNSRSTLRSNSQTTLQGHLDNSQFHLSLQTADSPSFPHHRQGSSGPSSGSPRSKSFSASAGIVV